MSWPPPISYGGSQSKNDSSALGGWGGGGGWAGETGWACSHPQGSWPAIGKVKLAGWLSRISSADSEVEKHKAEKIVIDSERIKSANKEVIIVIEYHWKSTQVSSREHREKRPFLLLLMANG